MLKSYPRNMEKGFREVGHGGWEVPPGAAGLGHQEAKMKPKGCPGCGGPADSCRKDACTPKKCQGSGGAGGLEG